MPTHYGDYDDPTQACERVLVTLLAGLGKRAASGARHEGLGNVELRRYLRACSRSSLSRSVSNGTYRGHPIDLNLRQKPGAETGRPSIPRA